jgi:hypothetical protein
MYELSIGGFRGIGTAQSLSINLYLPATGYENARIPANYGMSVIAKV